MYVREKGLCNREEPKTRKDPEDSEEESEDTPEDKEDGKFSTIKGPKTGSG